MIIYAYAVMKITPPHSPILEAYYQTEWRWNMTNDHISPKTMWRTTITPHGEYEKQIHSLHTMGTWDKFMVRTLADNHSPTIYAKSVLDT